MPVGHQFSWTVIDTTRCGGGRALLDFVPHLFSSHHCGSGADELEPAVAPRRDGVTVFDSFQRTDVAYGGDQDVGAELSVRGNGIELRRSAILLLAMHSCDYAGRAGLPCDGLSGGNSPV